MGALRNVLASPLSRATARRMRTCLRGTPLALLLACLPFEAPARAAPPPQPSISLEYAVKATYLYKLAPFVNWPPTEFQAADEPFRICVAGADPFDGFLQNAVARRGMGSHPFQVQRLATGAAETGQCQILFISHLPARGIQETLDAVRGKPVLTVVDSTEPVSGAVMRFVVRNGRVGFEIDTGAAAQNHLTISSKLLNLALAVRDGA